MKDFFDGYVEAALWSSNDPDTGQALDDVDAEVSPETLEKMRADCESFCLAAGHLIPDSRAAEAGHDFWLTRCQHGCGFWDGDWGDELGETLTDLCKPFPSVDLYVYGSQIHAV